MPVQYALSVKTARMTATRDACANGTVELQDAGGNALVVFGLSTSGGTVSGDTWNLVFDATTVQATGGSNTTMTQAVIKDAGGTVRISGLTVGLAAANPDVVVDAVAVTSGQNVTISSTAPIQHAA